MFEGPQLERGYLDQTCTHDIPLKSRWTFEIWINTVIFQWNMCVHVWSKYPLSNLLSDEAAVRKLLYSAPRSSG